MKKLGFTLAEVLITLVIIGVIAAMTVPTLMNNTQGQEYRAALKKAISSLNQALTLHYALDGETASDASDAANLVDKVFKGHMNVLDNSDVDWPTSANTDARTCDGTVFATTDGMMYCVTSFTPDNCDYENTTQCGTIYIDVNGQKAPNAQTKNTTPKDQYAAGLFNQKIIPINIDPYKTQDIMYDKKD